jgi:ABC-type Zn uptake system ZnuABC Zn-binding protein ZnuA
VRASFAALGLAAGALVALQAQGAAPLPVVATIEPLAMIVREIGGERVAVSAIVPAGASPHAFDPRPGDVARLAGARLLVTVGGELDGWVLRLRAAAGAEIETLALLDVPGLAPLAAEGGPAAPGARRDPHVWLDPIRVRDALGPAIAARLVALDAEGAAAYAARLADFQARLARLDAELRAALAGPRRAYVAFHPAWRYFGARYGLEEVGVVEESAGEDPTPRELAALVAAARRAAVPAILVEPQLDPRVARTLAAEFGATTVLVDPNGDPSDPARARYEDLLRWNARAFAGALGGAP